MILSTTIEEQHVDDGDVIRLRDGECSFSEERALRNHIRTCSMCKENADRIDSLADGFVAMVESIGCPKSVRLHGRGLAERAASRLYATTPVPWHGRRAVRVAAVVAAVCALALTAAPARALVLAGWQAIKTLWVGAPAAEHEAQQPTSLVSFVPQGEEFLIDFVRTQSLGSVSIAIDTSTSASARVVGGDGLDELIVLQAGLRVRNRTVSSASYELRLPSFLKDIEVRVEGRTVAAFSAAGMTGAVRWEVDLSNPGDG